MQHLQKNRGVLLTVLPTCRVHVLISELCLFARCQRKLSQAKGGSLSACSRGWPCSKRLLSQSSMAPSRLFEKSQDRKSTRLNSSHQIISYAVFCLKKKKRSIPTTTTHRYTIAPRC